MPRHDHPLKVPRFLSVDLPTSILPLDPEVEARAVAAWRERGSTDDLFLVHEDAPADVGLCALCGELITGVADDPPDTARLCGGCRFEVANPASTPHARWVRKVVAFSRWLVRETMEHAAQDFDEARRELACERGEPAGAIEGWTWRDEGVPLDEGFVDGWVRDCAYVGLRGQGKGSFWQAGWCERSIPLTDRSGRVLMRRMDAALAVHLAPGGGPR